LICLDGSESVLRGNRARRLGERPARHRGKMIGPPLREMAATNTKARQGTESHSGDRSAPL